MASVVTPAHDRPTSPVGSVLKLWRGHRRMSQLDLSARSGVTARHVSFVETGRAQPSRQLLDRLADALDIPLRDRNDLFLAAGFAAPYRALGLDDDELAVVTGAIDRILAGHEPFPAVVMDRHWNLLRTNHGADQLFGAMLDLSAVDPPANVLELLLSDRHLRPHVANWSRLAPALVARARREAVGGVPDARLSSLIGRFEAQLREQGIAAAPSYPGPVVDVAFIVEGTVRRYFSTITTLGTATDITLQEIRIELFHPHNG
jgi:transcriptional regulator with XRE-family HTH domain